MKGGVLSDRASGRMTSDGLWQLRLLFAWLDGLGHETETTSIAQTADDSKGSVWLWREVIESLRAGPATSGRQRRRTSSQVEDEAELSVMLWNSKGVATLQHQCNS